MEADGGLHRAELLLSDDEEFLARLGRALAPAYTVDRVIGTGGMGRVVAGQDVALRRPVAIKVLRAELTHPKAVVRLAREARTLARLDHPLIVPVFGVKEAEGFYCIIMRYMPGETLEQRLRQGPLGLDKVCDLGRDMLEALATAHRLEIVHRDVKPGNIFLTDGRALLGDFGISRSPEEATTEHGGAGTPGYAAPEQMSAEAPTHQSDLYSLGIVLYEAMTGRRFFAKGLYDEHRWKGVPRRLARVLRRAVAWAPEERWADARTFSEALDRARPRRLSRLAAFATAAAALAVVGYFAGRTAAADLATQPVNLAILPLRSSDPGDSAGHELARYAATRLEWFPPITFRPATYSFAWWDTTSAPRRNSDAPLRLNADRYVEGEIVDSGPRRVAMARVRDRQGRLVQTVRVSDLGAGMLAWGQALADSLVRLAYPVRYPAYRDLGATAGSTDQFAVNAFIAGENAFHRDAYAEAETRFREAVNLDPKFTIAAWHLALARRWLRVPFEGDLRRLSASEGANLPQHYRSLLSAQLEPDLATRLAKYRATIDSFPDDGYALLLYADELFHRGPLIGLGLDTALRVMESAARKDPYLDLMPALDHMIWGRLRLGDETSAERAVSERLRLGRPRTEGSPEAAQRLGLLRLAYHERFHPAWASVLRFVMLRRPGRERLLGIASHLRLALLFDVPESERALGAILVRSALDESMAAQGHEAQALALLMMGRPQEGVSHLDSAAVLFNTPASDLDRAEWRLLPPALGAWGADSTETAWARARLGTLSSDSATSGRAAWALALDATLAGRRDEASRWRGVLTSSNASDGTAESLVTLLSAADTGAAGDTNEALRQSRSLATTQVIALFADPFARSALFLLRARWLATAGRSAAADSTLRWYENSHGEDYPQGPTEATDVDAVLSAHARILRGRLGLKGGDSAGICAGLHRVRELWAGAEPMWKGARMEVDSLLSRCHS